MFHGGAEKIERKAALLPLLGREIGGAVIDVGLTVHHTDLLIPISTSEMQYC